MDRVRRAVAVVGSTATGKSALAHQVAMERGDTTVLCVDSMTVYRHMDIATAKPTTRERTQVAYQLLDLVDPCEEFTLAQFQRAARDAADIVWKGNGAVIYAGGTGLYGRAVIDNFDIPAQFAPVRRELESRSTTELDVLYEELRRLDPLAAQRMEPTNARRVVRALEVTLGSGRPFSSYGAGVRQYGPVRVVQIGLRVDPEELDRRIEDRFRRWLDDGLLDEVRSLAALPGGLSRTARQAVGYRELLAHVEDGRALDACVRDAITQSRRLARRQRSWFTRDPRIEWFDDAELAADRMRDVLNGPDGFVRD